MPLGSLDVVGAAIIFSVGMALIVAVRWLTAWLRARMGDAEKAPDASAVEFASDRTARWVGTVIAGIAGAVGIGLVQFADVVGMATMFLGQHPLAAVYAGVAGLGALVIEGFVSMSGERYLGVALAVLGLVMVAIEVDADAD